jgi:hypothetical protein
MIELDDFVMLGTTVPEPNSDGRVFVCSAGVTRQLRQLIRIYPLARRGVPTRWHRYRVKLERPAPNHDSRYESWKLAGDRSPEHHDDINQTFEECGSKVRPDKRAELLQLHQVESIALANERRMSLAVIRPRRIEVAWEHRPNEPEALPLQLFEPEARKAETARFEWIPRLVFKDTVGEHRLMLRDWGTFELLRKRGDDYAKENLAGALHLGPDSALLVGNINNQRTAWLVVSVLNAPTGPDQLFQDEQLDPPPIQPTR